MSAPPGLTEAAATLLQADPALARTVGARAATEIGHRAILPVLSVPAGRWIPPAPALLGTGTFACVVLDGLLIREAALRDVLGPEDVFEPWDAGARWTACTPVRLAVIGVRYVEALQPWPEAAARLLSRADSRPRAATPTGTRDERLLALLWRIAGRWGWPDADGVALPRALDAVALSALLDLSEHDVADGLSGLSAGGTAAFREGFGWLLREVTAGPAPGHSRERRDELRSRGAHQLAVARAALADSVVLCEELEGELRRSERRRRGRT